MPVTPTVPHQCKLQNMYDVPMLQSHQHAVSRRCQQGMLSSSYCCTLAIAYIKGLQQCGWHSLEV